MVWKLCAVSAILAVFLCASGCHGFFVNPTVSSISVSPATNNLQIGGSRQLTAIANYSDGTTKDVTGLAIWNSSDSTGSFVTVSNSGVVKALQATSSTVTVTADYKGFSGSATVTVGASTLNITSSLGTSISLASHPGGSPITFTATLNGADVTSSTTFSSNSSGVITITSGSNGTVGGSTGTATISGNNGTASGTLQITVGP